jgi:predicted DCC family thiol-disulfide oxidoreductase YuxK
VDFVDITSPDYTPEANGGVEFAAAMGRLHAVLPDNRVIQNMEVLRQVYEVLDLGWVYGFSRWPWIRPLVDWSYDRWAEWRLAITGRPSLVTIVAARKQQLQTLNCDAPQRCIRNTD